MYRYVTCVEIFEHGYLLRIFAQQHDYMALVLLPGAADCIQ